MMSIEKILYREPKERAEIIIEQLESLVETAERDERIIRELRAELKKPSDERLVGVYAEIKMLKDKIDDIRSKSLHVFTDGQKIRARKIWEEHAETCSRGYKNYWYEVHPTGLGSVVKFCCPCGYKEEVCGVADW